MAVKFGIRNFSRSGDSVTFTLVALNANGTIDTTYTGNFTWGLNGMSDPGTPTFVAGDMGQRTFTTTILNPNVRTGLAANFPGSSSGANLSVSGPNGTNVSFGNQGDHLIVGGAGADVLSGNNGNDLFLMQQGGNDTVNGGAGDDGFYFGGAYTIADTIDGGAGNDQLALQGDYAAATAIGNMTGVEMIVLLPGNDNRFGGGTGASFNYNLVAQSSLVAANNRLTIQANTLRAGENFSFDGSALSADLLIYAGLGTDILTGGSGNDGFLFGEGRFGPGDIVNGGAGTLDQIGFLGNFGGLNAIIFGANQMVGIEFLVALSAADTRFGAAGGSASYEFIMHDGNVAAGQTLVVSGNTLQAGETLRFQGQAETDGRFDIYSGAGDDYLVGGQNADYIHGGAGNDVIVGSGGADILYGGSGENAFIYFGPNDSTALARDQIRDFKLNDYISLTPIASSSPGGAFTFIGSGPQTDARQVQVLQNGTAATVNIFIDGDANADLVIDVTVIDGHVMDQFDFLGVRWFMEPGPAPKANVVGDLPDMRDGLRFETRFDHLDLGIVPTHDLLI